VNQTKFDLGLLLLSLVSQKLVGFISLSFTAPMCTEESFHLALRAQPNMCLVSLGLLDPNLTWFTFPQPGFSKTCWGTFPSASRHQHVEKSRFTWPWEPNQVCASFPSAFWTQTNFDLGLLSLSLVSQKLVGYVSLSFTAPTCREESFHLALRT